MARKLSDLEKRIYNKAAAINARIKSMNLKKLQLNDFEKALINNSEFNVQVENMKASWGEIFTVHGNVKRVYSQGKDLKLIESLLDSMIDIDSPVKNLNNMIRLATGIKNISSYRKTLTQYPTVITALANITNRVGVEAVDYQYYDGSDENASDVAAIWQEFRTSPKKPIATLLSKITGRDVEYKKGKKK